MDKYALWSISRSGHCFIKNNLRSWFGYKETFSGENWPEEKLKTYLKRNENPFLFITIRDPFNNIASLMKHLLNQEHYPQSAMDAYIPRILEYWCEMNDYADRNKNCIPVYYNNFLEKDYRVKLCNELGLEYNEEYLDVVPPSGGYSSFDGKEYNGSGSKMDTKSRWEKMVESEHKEKYVKYLLSNKKVIDICEKKNMCPDILKEFKKII